jgi:hypothetical protein
LVLRALAIDAALGGAAQPPQPARQPPLGAATSIAAKGF